MNTSSRACCSVLCSWYLEHTTRHVRRDSYNLFGKYNQRREHWTGGIEWCWNWSGLCIQSASNRPVSFTV